MRRSGERLAVAWTALVVLLIYMPFVSVVLASLANTRYLRFPHRIWSLDAYRDALGQYLTWDLHGVSFRIAAWVAVLSVLMAVPGALAFARFEWRGRALYRKLILLPVFFPQPVLGLAFLVFLSALGLTPTWKTAVLAHLVLIAPIVTLVVAITLYGFDRAQEEAAFDLGASRLQAFREITLPAILPGVLSGGLFAFLLSWSNLPLSAFTTGADTTLPEWLYSRMATNYAPTIPAVAVLSVAASLGAVFAVLFAAFVARALRKRLPAPQRT
jgi:spermidine/putrescine transport system permease protein